MAEATVVIDKVFTQSGNNSKGDWTRYDVKAGGKKFQTFNDALGEKAQGLQKETVKIVYTEKQSGEYTNYEIKSIDAATALAIQGTKPSSNGEDDRQLRIMRQSGLERAIRAATVLGLEDVDVNTLYDISDEFVRYFTEGQQVPAEDGPRF